MAESGQAPYCPGHAAGYNERNHCLECGRERKPKPNWQKAADEIFRLGRNYEVRTHQRAHTAFDVLLHPWTWREVQQDPFIGHNAQWMPPRLFGFAVLQSNEVPEGDVRLVIKPDHQLLADPPKIPPGYRYEGEGGRGI